MTSTCTHLDANRFITFLDLFVPYVPESKETKGETKSSASSVKLDDEAVWEGSKGHVYEQLFWKAAGGALKRTAAALNVDTLRLSRQGTALSNSEVQARVQTAKASSGSKSESKTESKSDGAGAGAGAASSSESSSTGSSGSSGKATPLTNGDVKALRAQLLATFDRENVFDYSALLLRIIRGCAEALKSYVPQWPTVKEEIDKVKVVNTQASGDEFMVPYEISFETNFAHRQVAFADPFKLTEKHVEAMINLFKVSDRAALFRAQYLNLFDTGCHEVLHCVQGVAEQTDGKPLSWSAEHDASYAAMSLMWAVSQLDSMRDLFADGFAFEVFLQNLNWARRCVAKWSDETKAEYFKWRDAFGLYSPSKKIGDDPDLVDEFKGVLTTENTHIDNKLVQAQLDILFDKKRTGDVHKVPIGKLPDAIALKQGKSREGYLNF